jgi:hypothetical protein
MIFIIDFFSTIVEYDFSFMPFKKKLVMDVIVVI